MSLLIARAVVGGGSGAPVGAQYVVLTLDGTLTAERVLVGTANQVVLTDAGAGGNLTLSLPQDYDIGATPTLGGLTLTGLLQTGAGKIANTTRITDADSAYAVLATDEVIFCDTDGGAIIANLPAGIEGTHYKLINAGSSGNDLTLNGNGAETIWGDLAFTLIDGDVIDLHYNATEGWW